jgi:hypothetical protein
MPQEQERYTSQGCVRAENMSRIQQVRIFGKNKVTSRPKYINEAFWESQDGAERFRQWLLSGDGMKHRQRWNESVMNHTVLRYVVFAPPQNLSDD